MKKGVLLIVLFVLCSLSVTADWFYNSEEVVVQMEIKGGADIIERSTDADVQYVDINLSLFPKDSVSQDVEYTTLRPVPSFEEDAALYNYPSPGTEVDFEFTSRVVSKNTLIPITEKVSFPLHTLPDDVLVYTQPTSIINSDAPEIIALASSLAEGEDDLYRVVFNIAKWTKENIAYNLSTLTAEVSQPSTWVLQQRKGVCDELTSLFIAMLRSVGIPARFITGYAYTNSELFDENWGAHGWAEVYFPGHGWIPYDVTYGQYAYVDPTHITLKVSKDPKESSTRYQWLGRDVDLEVSQLVTKVTLVDVKGEKPSGLGIKLKPIKNAVGFSSFNGIEAQVTNTLNSYIATDIGLTLPAELTLLSEKTQAIALEPGQTVSVFWLIQNTDLDRQFLYTFPVVAYTSRNLTAQTTFSSAYESALYDSEDIQAIINQRKGEEQKTYSANVEVVCDPSSAQMYTYEQGDITCTVSNRGNTFLSDVDVCYGEDCKRIDLGISQHEVVIFEPTLTVGKTQQNVIVGNSDVSKAAEFDLEILDEPSLSLIDLSAPEQVKYGEDYSIGFVLNATSYSTPEDIDITVGLPFQEQGWEMDALHNQKEFLLTSQGDMLRPGQNTIDITVLYHDQNDQEYETKETVTVTLVDLSITEKIRSSFFRSLYYLDDLGGSVHFSLFVTGAIVFLGVVLFVFRRKR